MKKEIAKTNIEYLALWEQMHNPDVKGVEIDTFKNEAGTHYFTMSPQRWIKETNAIGIISKSGNNGGTYAHPDIAFEFASWISPEFNWYLITEFERLKQNEGNILQINKADMVFTRPNGKYVGRNILNYPFKIIHKELGIENCRFYDLRGSYATINLRNGTEIRDVADILGHKYIETTENFYISSTDENKKDVSNVFDSLMSSETINNIIKYEIAY